MLSPPTPTTDNSETYNSRIGQLLMNMLNDTLQDLATITTHDDTTTEA